MGLYIHRGVIGVQDTDEGTEEVKDMVKLNNLSGSS